VLTQLLITEYK